MAQKKKQKSKPPRPPKPKPVLTDKEELFCLEYLKDLNLGNAATRAGFKNKRPRQYGYKLMQRVEIENRISQLMEERKMRLRVDGDTVIKHLAVVAFADMRKYAAWGPGPAKKSGKKKGQPGPPVISIHPSDQVDGRAVQSIKPVKDGVAIKLHNKVSALDLLARHFGLVGDVGTDTSDMSKKMREILQRNREPKPVEVETKE